MTWGIGVTRLKDLLTNVTKKIRDANFVRRNIWKGIRYLEKYGIGLIGVLFGLTIILGVIGFNQYYQSSKTPLSLEEVLYLTFQLLTLKSGNIDWSRSGYILTLDIARWSGLLVFISATVILLMRFFSEQLNSLRLLFYSNHIVVCGTGRIGSRFARAFIKEGYQVVVIEQNKNNSSLEEFKYTNAIVLIGNATDPRILHKARLQQAKFLIPALGDDNVNTEVAIQAQKVITGSSRDPPTCFVQVLDPRLCDLLKVKEMENENGEKLQLEFFNIFSNGAKAMLDDNPGFEKKCAGDKKDNVNAHIIVIGLGDMGESLVVAAGKRWWQNHMKTGSMLDVTIIDKHARKKLDSLCLQYTSLNKFCRFETEDMDIRCLDKLKMVILKAVDKPGGKDEKVEGIYICLDKDSEGLSLALVLRQWISDRNIPIVVRVNSDAGLAGLLSGSGISAGFDNTYAFGLWDRTCNKDLILNGTHEIIAEALHEDYRQKQIKPGVEIKSTLKPWKEISEEFKESNRDLARHIRVKMKAIVCGLTTQLDWEEKLFEFTPFEILMLSILEHERWRAEKRRKGWKKGREWSDVKKTNPACVGWINLSEEQKVKDIDTVCLIPEVLSRVDLKIFRRDIQGPIAKAIYNDVVQRKILSDPGNGPRPIDWEKLSEAVKQRLVSDATNILGDLGRTNCAIMGKVSPVKGMVEFTGAKLDSMAKARFDRSLASAMSGPGVIGALPTWDTLGEGDKKLFRDEVNRLPIILDRLELKVYDVDEEMKANRSDIELVVREVEKLKKKQLAEISIT
jgi:voltage-gated potassium channel Kch